MKKICYVLPLIATVLVGCRKTEQAYAPGRFNSSNFENNYYTEWDGVDKLNIGNVSKLSYIKSQKDIKNFYDPGFEVHNLIKEENRFAYGVLSKLYDGKLRCDGMHQTMLRVQLNKTGYGTFFPKEFVTSESFAFALRGATSIPDSEYSKTKPRVISVKINAVFKFYIRREGTNVYDQVNMEFENLEIPSDNWGLTTYVSCLADMDLIKGADAMSFEYSLIDPATQYTNWDVTDDYTVEGKVHFAIMMYEVLFPFSKWY